MLSHLAAMAGSKDAVVRIHSDNALELVTENMVKQINARGIFKTVAVPYNPCFKSKSRACSAILEEGGVAISLGCAT